MNKRLHSSAGPGQRFVPRPPRPRTPPPARRRPPCASAAMAFRATRPAFPQVHKVPMISGQGAKYIANSLAAYKKGERRHPTMRAIAASLSDKDMADLAAYYEKHGASSFKTVADTPAVQPSAEVAALLAKGACASCHGANFSKPIDGLPQDRRPACRLPVRGAARLCGGRQPQRRPRQRHHGGPGQAVQAGRAQAAGPVHRLAAGRAAHLPQPKFR
jgi:cytochrome c553